MNLELHMLEFMSKFELEYPGYIKFISELQVGKQIKFKNCLRFKDGITLPHSKEYYTIKICGREEIGSGLGMGRIWYKEINELTKEIIDDSSYYPCQTFKSMRDWFRYSESYEILDF